MNRLILVALAGCLAGCASQQQAAIPPSPTGCYMVNRGLITAAIYGRYAPAPCNVVNAADPPRAVSGNSDYTPPAVPVMSPPPLNSGGAWSIAGPGGVAGGAGGVWSGAGTGWAGGGAALP